MKPIGPFWGEAYGSFVRTGGFVFGLVGLALGGWAILFPSPFSVDGRWLMGVVVVAYMLVAPFFDLAARSHEAVTPKPKVRMAMMSGEQPLILVYPSAAFGSDTAVVVYQQDRGFEIEIGVGRANRIQGGDSVQVLILDTRGRDELWTRICASEAGILDTLIVKSALPFDVYQRLSV